MQQLDVHHDLAVELLVGRSLPTGIPWTLDEDHLLIAREQVLWDKLSPEEQRTEQEFLSSLWRVPEDQRFLPVNRAWGPWALDLPEKVRVTNDAFGLTKNAYRPNPKGRPPAGAFPEYDQTFEWLWQKGFQVVDVSNYGFSLAIPFQRVVQ